MLIYDNQIWANSLAQRFTEWTYDMSYSKRTEFI